MSVSICSCQWCQPRRQTRVVCTAPRRWSVRKEACGHQWLLELSPTCLVCGSSTYERVRPTPGDLRGLVNEAADAVGAIAQVDPEAALPLADALRAVVSALATRHPAFAAHAALS